MIHREEAEALHFFTAAKKTGDMLCASFNSPSSFISPFISVYMQWPVGQGFGNSEQF
jgi:hypothetical protein